jgi:hypothetical protein
VIKQNNLINFAMKCKKALSFLSYLCSRLV